VKNIHIWICIRKGTERCNKIKYNLKIIIFAPVHMFEFELYCHLRRLFSLKIMQITSRFFSNDYYVWYNFRKNKKTNKRKVVMYVG
jgi:hypothetical protein